MKTCFKCGTSQPLDNFYKHKMMGDGHLGKCKECTKKDVTKHRNENIEKVREYDRERGKTKIRKELAAIQSKKWRSEDPRRLKSHNAIARAIKKGTLVKHQCCVCRSDESMAHHESYDRPLDVVWYCQIHHKERHKQMKAEGIEP